MKCRVRRAVLGSVRVASAVVLLACGCHRAVGTPPGIPGPMASALLAFAAEQGTPPEDVANTWALIEAMAARVSARRIKAGQDPIDHLNTVVFGDLGFVREIDRREIDRADAAFLLLPSVVTGRRGSCVGLAALYLTLGERLGIPVAGALVPSHFFVRVAGPRGRNVELLRGGEAMPDDWYARKYGPWDASVSAYMRPLTIFEVISVHWFNVGNQRRAARDLPGAVDAYRRAVAGFPDFAEAAASLGAVEHLHGDLPAARLSYRAAARARSDLPGLAHNLSLLEAEQSAPSPAGPSQNTEQKSGNPPRRSLP